MLFKEVDSKLFFELDKDFLLKHIFLIIVNMLEYKHVYAFKSFINKGKGGVSMEIPMRQHGQKGACVCLITPCEFLPSA